MNDYLMLTTAYSHSAKGTRAKVREIQLLVVGYDVDRSREAAKISIKIHPDDFSETNATVDFQALGDQFVFITAGYDESTQLRLQYPELFLDVETLKWYNAARKEGRATQLSLLQLESLAAYLEKDAAESRLIGGPVQIATLQNDSAHVRPVKGLSLPRVPRKVFFVLDVGLVNFTVPQILVKGTDTVAYINDSCTNAAVTLDQGVSYEGFYDHCSFLFNGGFFKRDKAVTVLGGKLVVGPDIPLDDPRVAGALERFPELTPVSYQTLHLPAATRNQLWDSSAK